MGPVQGQAQETVGFVRELKRFAVGFVTSSAVLINQPKFVDGLDTQPWTSATNAAVEGHV